MYSKEYQREWYRKNKEKRHLQSIQCKRRIKDKLVSYYGNKCFNCNNTYPSAVFDFHHLDPNEKDFNISSQKVGYEKLLEETKKCVMLCANCHRILHAEKGSKYENSSQEI